MNRCFSRNFFLLKERFPLVEARILDPADPALPVPVPAESGHWTLRRPTPKGEEVFLHSPRDPRAEGERIARSIPDDPGMLVFLGGAFFYHVTAVLPRLGEGVPLIVVEEDPVVFTAALSVAPISPLLEREETLMFVGESPGSIVSSLMTRYSPEVLAGMTILRHLPSLETAPDEYRAVEVQLKGLRDLADCRLNDPGLGRWFDEGGDGLAAAFDEVREEHARDVGKSGEVQEIFHLMQLLRQEK